MTGSAVKHDAGKPRVDLLPPDALLAAADVMRHGAEKYGDRDWERGLDHGRVYAAAQRHLLAWLSGEDADPETRAPHLAHASCCILMLLALTLRSCGRDDRSARAGAMERDAPALSEQPT